MNHSYLLSLLLPKPMTHLVFTFIFVPLASTFLLLICRKLCFPTAEVLENIFPKALENRGFSNDLCLRLWVAEKALRVMRHDSAGGPSLFIGNVGRVKNWLQFLSKFSSCDAFHGALWRP